MSLVKIYSSVPEPIRDAILEHGMERMGHVVFDRNHQPAGMLQSTTGFVPKGELPEVVAKAFQLAELGIQANPIALGVHAASSFAVIAHQIEHIKSRLEDIAEKVDKVDAKVDLGYYAKFQAAIELGNHAFSMQQEANKASMAHKAVQLFVETKNIYSHYIQEELEQEGRAATDYFLILVLSYMGQVKCCMEIEELASARRILQDSAQSLKAIASTYIQLLLSDNPAIYLHNDFQDLGIDLTRMARVYKWLGRETDENQLFQALRTQFVHVHQHEDKAFANIPQLIWNPVLDVETKGDRSRLAKLNPLSYFRSPDTRPFLKKRLQESFGTIEQLMEAHDRLASLTYELDVLTQEGITYATWKAQLTEAHQPGQEVLYIELSQAA